MENQGTIYEIKSKYILKHILNHVQDKHFQLKLLSYSKNLQKKLDINYSYYYKKYLDELNFDLNKYLYKEERKYKKDILKREYDNFISKKNLNKEIFEKIIFEVIKSETDKNIYINMDCPLFEILTKKNVFNKNFIIYISQKNIDDYKLRDDYLIMFNKQNKSNIEYSSIKFIWNQLKK